MTDNLAHYTLNGDLNQMSIMRQRLREAGFPVVMNDVYHGFRLADKDEYIKALQFLFDNRVSGWWNQKERLFKEGICTLDEYAMAIGRGFDAHLPDLKPTLQECLDDIKEWTHLDEYRHGNKIVVKNARVEIMTQNLDPKETDEEYKKIWGHYDYWYNYFTGDLSTRRFEYLLKLSGRWDCFITVTHERGMLAFKISDGTHAGENFEGYHKLCGNPVMEEEDASGQYTCHRCGRVNTKDIMPFRGDCDE